MDPHNVYHGLFRSQAITAKDPGAGNIINVERSYAEVGLEIGTSADATRFLPAPLKSGLEVTLAPVTVGSGGSGKVAINASSGTPSATFDGTNKFVTINGYSQFVKFRSVKASSTTYQWSLAENQGATLSVS